MTARRLPAGLFAALVVAACAAPFAVLALLSVADGWTFSAPWLTAWRLGRWREALAGDLASSTALSVALSLAVALASTAGGLATGRAVARCRHRRAWLWMAYLPFASSPVVLSVGLVVWWIRAGWAGTLGGVALAQLVFGYAYGVVFFASFWTPRLLAYGDLVRTLGGSAVQALRLGAWPVARSAAALCLAQTFLLSWFQYGLTLVVGQGRVSTLPVRVFAYVGEADAGLAAVASLVLVGPPLAMLWLNRRLLRVGMGDGG